jgi:hypothetical protein
MNIPGSGHHNIEVDPTYHSQPEKPNSVRTYLQIQKTKHSTMGKLYVQAQQETGQSQEGRNTTPITQ